MMLGLIVFLLTVGLILVVVEWFLPNGAAGALGVCALIAAVVLSYREYGFAVGTEVLGGVLVASVVGTIVWLRYFPRMGPGKRMLLETQSGGQPQELKQFLNKEGVALSTLRPSGVARIEGQHVDVVSEVEHIEAGSPIRVVAVEGRRVVVRKIE